jgi:2-polyprenyl-3-methyl-5-hydroxy-6-metoxy-1,4-benzoquinol methylase
MKPCPLCEGPGKEERRVDECWLLRCRHCGFVYADATVEEIERVNFQYDDSVERRYGEIQTGIDTLWFDRVSARLTRGRPGLKVLDVGCGNGMLLRQFQKRGCLCFGSDPSPWARTCAERYGYTLLPRIEDADIEPGSFDIITSTSALEHIARPLEHMTRLLEILKPGGTAYFTVPNYGSWPIRLHLVKGRLVAPPGHCSYFTARTLRNLCRRPDLSEEALRVRVRSYGIPEIHAVYGRFSRRGARSAPGARRVEPGRLWLKKALVSIYYWSGAPFCLGDKLEATIWKGPFPPPA